MNFIQLLRLSSIVLAGVAMVACSGGNKGGQEATDADAKSQKAWELDVQTVEARDKSCQGKECTYALFKTPLLKGGNDTARERINSDVDAIMRESIKARLPEPTAMGTYESLAESFLEGFELFRMEFPENATPWHLQINGSKSALGEEYFVLRLEISEFMGGAHANYYTLLQTYTLKDGAMIDVRDVVDEATLTMQAEQAFREKHGLGPGDSLNDKGFMFPDGTFILPENMAITDRGILLIYNPYEVASYALGVTELVLQISHEPA